ncbi:NAD(P)H-dependent oxidoreductase [Pelagibacterium sp. 26DY04]|uniref:NADPH-dependent FMN reductase n=1 Tax=unclassified Pelagibacterium TaxID=2623280 RepID=UPI0028159B37|nr:MULTISPECIES: NAD(P)H-dependent oxidoreductase [unclassified Pelagibacterium]WMT88026.1 NAD(P)H-dependent oxidoreductase [Pelagibacterium sp. 26DY04]WMT91209.1 NAD(P)H-dependent oxidoreductase [Pelagibacterium sp. H642]
MTVNLKIIIGSTRPGRVGPTIARWVEAFASEREQFDVELVDLAEVGLPLLDEAAIPFFGQYQHEHTKRWSTIVSQADAFVFVTPEYNFFPPASLVNAIQVLLAEWGRKPAGIVSYGGISAGLRSAQALRQLLGNVNVHALAQMVPIPNFAEFIGEDGVFRPNQPMEEGAAGMLEELHKWAAALKPLRQAEAGDGAHTEAA